MEDVTSGIGTISQFAGEKSERYFARHTTRQLDLELSELNLLPESGCSRSEVERVAIVAWCAVASGGLGLVIAAAGLIDHILQLHPGYLDWRLEMIGSLLQASGLVAVHDLTPTEISNIADIVLAVFAIIGIAFGGWLAGVAYFRQRQLIFQTWNRPSLFWPVSPGFKNVSVGVGNDGVSLNSRNQTIEISWLNDIDYDALIDDPDVNPGLREALRAPERLPALDEMSDFENALINLGEECSATLKSWAKKQDVHFLRIPLKEPAIPSQQKDGAALRYYATAIFPKKLFRHPFEFHAFVALCVYHGIRSGKVDAQPH